MHKRLPSGLVLGLALAACGAAGSAGTAQRVEVFKADGSRQCEPDSGQSPAAMRTDLEAAGIRVHAARSASDGMLHMQVCGAPTGRINVFSIDAAGLDAARSLGFQPLAGPR